MKNRRSRLSRRLEKQSKKQMFLSIFGILIIFFLLIKFGIPVLSGVSGLIIKVNEKTSSQSNDQNKDTFLQTPMLDPILSATSSSEINISGKSNEKEGDIETYLNNELDHRVNIDKNGTFHATISSLKEGINLIKVRFRSSNDNKTSDFTDESSVSYTKSAPSLDINSPSDNTEFKKGSEQIYVKGKTDPDNKVTVNGFWATMDESGNFSYYLKLNEGDNTVTVEAENPVGVKTTKTIKVKYQP